MGGPGEDRAAAAGHSVDTEEWLAEFDTGFARIAGRFARVEPRRRARAFMLGWLSDVDIAGADKSSARVTSLIIDPGLSAAMPFALAVFTLAADWRHHDLSCCCAWPISL